MKTPEKKGGKMGEVKSSQPASQPHPAPESGFVKRMRESIERKLGSMDQKVTGEAIRRSGESIRDYQNKHSEERVLIANKQSLPPPHSKKVAKEYNKLLGIPSAESSEAGSSELKGRIQAARPETPPPSTAPAA